MKNGFKIIGVSIRTTNKDNQAQKDLGALWAKFYAENIFDKIPNKVSGEILSVYTDYKNDYTEDYTTIIGVPVSSLERIPDGLTGREFQPENFIKFTAKGKMPDAIADTWLNIWNKDKDLNRKYTYDFEVYGDKARLGDNSEVDIFIATQ